MEYVTGMHLYIMTGWISQHKWTTTGITAVLLVGGFFIFSGGNGDSGIETITLDRRDVQQTISETGIVNASDDAELAFEIAGRVADVHVTSGYEVTAGEPLVTLENEDQQAAVAAARARLDDLRGDDRSTTADAVAARVTAAEVALENARSDLARVRDTQNEAVQDAREDLLSNDLAAFFTGESRGSSGYSYTPPTISGTYMSDETGQYVIDPYSSGADSGYSIRYEWEGDDGSSRTGVATISTDTPQPLGDNGLYIQFPEDFARDSNVEWTVDVPNERSSTYVTKRNTYESALENRDNAIAAAEEKVESAAAALAEVEASGAQTTGSASESRLRGAQAELRQAKLALERTELTAPFSGTIADLSISTGESVSPGSPVAWLASSGFEISVDVPEADISRLEVGDRATVTLDAFDDLTMEAEVTELAARARRTEGVTTLETTLQIDGSTEGVERLIPGLSADLEIAAAAAREVLAVPARSILGTMDDSYVRVVQGDPETITLNDIERRSVTTGLRGSDGYIEITSGLDEGDVVVTFLPEELRDELAEREFSE